MKAAGGKQHRAVVLMVTALLCVQSALPVFWDAQRASAAGFNPAVYARIDTVGKQIIHLPAGIYEILRPLVLPSNTTLEGEGKATILTKGASFIGSRFITNSNSVHGNKNIVLRNLQVRFDGPALTGDAIGIVRFYNVRDLLISNVTMAVDSPMYAIDLSDQIQNATVEGCTITNINKASGGGIMIRNGDRLSSMATSSVIIRNNNVTSITDEAISLFGWLGEVAKITVQGNTVNAHGASFGIAAYGIDSKVQSGRIHGIRIVNNIISGGSVGGIGVKGGAQAVEITENSIEDTEGDGIFLHSGGAGLPGVQDIQIHQNTVINAGRHGIFASGEYIDVKKNTVRRCGQSGVFAAGIVSVIGNVIIDAKPSILLYGGQESNIIGNKLSNDGRVLILDKDGSVLKDIVTGL